MKRLAILLPIFIVCSADNGLTRTFFEHAHHIYYSHNCLMFAADKLDNFGAVCAPETECVIEEGEAPPSSELLEPKHVTAPESKNGK